MTCNPFLQPNWWKCLWPGLLLFSLLFSPSCVQPTETNLNAAGNRAPIIKSMKAVPVSIVVGNWTTIEVDAEDPDDGALTFQWYANAGDIIGSGPSIRYTASYCCVGFNYVRVTAEDQRGGSSSGSIDIQVLR